MSIHEGHRQRMRVRFEQMGLDGFQDHEILEMLLYYCIPRKNTNEIAHRLLKEFESISRVFNASAKELERVEGVGHNTALFLTMIRQTERFFRPKESENEHVLTGMEKCYKHLVQKMAARRNETVMLLCLDAKCKELGCHIVSEGSMNAANISIRKIVDIALSTNASSVVLAHNHPSGIALPSQEDVQTTKQISMALRMVDVILADHIVVADNDYVSLCQSALYNPNEIYGAF
jgi:DNA repair protein RadC